MTFSFISISNLEQTIKAIQMREQIFGGHSLDPNFRGTYADHPQNITDKHPSEWQKIVPVSDKVKQDIIDAVRKEFMESGGMGDENSAHMKIKLSYLQSISATERSSVGWTLDQIKYDEAKRISDFIKTKDPSWDWGRPVKPEILAEAYKSPQVDIKI